MKITKIIKHDDDLIEEQYVNGDKRWLKNNKYHRENGPAIEQNDGTKYWYISGNLHRDNGPAIESVDGYKKWYIEGKLHRIDGPAIEWNNGDKHWYINGELHRVGYAAIEYSNGSQHWYQNGLLHREDGPAIEDKYYNHCVKQWRFKGREYTEQEFNIMKMKNELNKELINNDVKPKRLKL
jgi:hypothetical protein